MRSRKRKARGSLLVGLAVYFVLQAGLSILLAGKWAWLRSPNYGYRELALRAREKTPSGRAKTVLMFGSSRVVNGFQASMLDESLSQAAGRPVRAYNFGFWGAGPFTDLLSVRRLLADGHRPDFVLIEVLPIQMEVDASILDSREIFLPRQRLRHGELALLRRYVGDKREVSSRDWWLSWVHPVFSHRFALVSSVAPWLLRNGCRTVDFRIKDEGGWIPVDTRFSNSERRRAALEHVRQGYAGLLQTMEVSGKYVRLLDEILALCAREKIPATLVRMPEGPVFRGWYSPAVSGRVRGLLDDLHRRHGVRVIDAQRWVDDEECFLDSHHLLPEGAAIFTRRLGEELTKAISAGRVFGDGE